MSSISHTFRYLTLALSTAALSGCLTVGPDYQTPVVAAPGDWSTLHSGSEKLSDAHVQAQTDMQTLPMHWWVVFDNATLNGLQQRALAASPDLQTAALHFAQSRLQRQMTAAQRGIDVNASGNVTRQRSSEHGATARTLDQIGPAADRDALIAALSQPFDLYQGGFDASWELDLWGRIRRSIEAADAAIDVQAALLDQARLSITSEVARNYFELRVTQQQIDVARQVIRASEESLRLTELRTQHGLTNDLDLERQRSQLADTRARLPQLLAQETVSINQIGLLLGVQPGELQDELHSHTNDDIGTLPDLSLGIPSETVRRRPDIRAAEAQLHQATANIGIAVAELYPRIRLGASFGYESTQRERFSDWGSRQWSIGPSLSIPVFDHGRRRSQIELRKLEQQEAAIAYQRTILKAWQEVDDALSRYSAERQHNQSLQEKLRSSQNAYTLAQVRYAGGLTDYLVELDAQRTYLQARSDLIDSNGQLRLSLVAVYKAIGGGLDEGAESMESPARN
ncbi:MAG: efflux transporter outer membrane subunit [Xanthomonadaceae bacterium]|jgi:NodT family efflux transporter outer membrane factor (OMF) lipoprotein|nr:efflux transporter outer membrane subunit [Xanthomonadaceae bacterium]